MRDKGMLRPDFGKKNKPFAAIICLQLLLVLFFLVSLVGNAAEVGLFPENWSTTDGAAPDMQVTREDNALHITWPQNHGDLEVPSLQFALPYGGYELALDYAMTLTEPPAEPAGETTTPTCTVGSLARAGNVKMESTSLQEGSHQLVTRLYVSRLGRVQDASVRLKIAAGANGGELWIYGLTMTENVGYRWVRLLEVLLLFAAIDAVYLLLFENGRKRLWLGEENARVCLCLLGIILLSSLPLFSDYLLWSYDTAFHVSRIAFVGKELANHQFPVRMMTGMLGGYGYPTPLYYCDIFLYIPALLYNCLLPLHTCFQVYTVFINAATCLLAYVCFWRMTQSKQIALAGSALYTLSAYRCYTLLYLRGALGEYTAMTFLPLVVLGCYQIYTAAGKVGIKQWLPLSLGMAGLVQCHAISFEMTVYFLLLFCLVNLRKTLSWNRLFALIKSALLAMGLAAWFIVPLVSSMLQQKVNAQDGSYYSWAAEHSLYPYQFLALFQSNSGFLQIAERKWIIPTSLGLPLVLGIALVLYCCLCRKRWAMVEEKRSYHVMRMVFFLGLAAVAVSSYYFPWSVLENFVGSTFLGLFTIQYVWRYLNIATILLVTAAVFALVLLKEYRQEWLRRTILVLCGAAVLATGLYYMQLPYQDGVHWFQAWSSNSIGDGEVGLREYFLLGADRQKVNQPLPNDPNVELLQTVVQGSEKLYTCTNHNAVDTAYDLPVFHYANYHVYDQASGQELATDTGENQTIRVTLPAGYQGTLLVRYEPPLYWRASEVLTLLTLLGLGALLWQMRRKTKRKK